jgi:hypothetical protein
MERTRQAANVGLGPFRQSGQALDHGRLADELERRIVGYDVPHEVLQHVRSTDQDNPDGADLVPLGMAS